MSHSIEIYVFGSSFGFRPGVRSVRHYIEKSVFSCVLSSEPIIARNKNHQQLKSKCYDCYGMACWRRFGDRAQAFHFIDLPPSMIFGIHSWMLRPSRACSELLWNGMLEEMCKIPQTPWSGGGVPKIRGPCLGVFLIRAREY